MRERSRSGVPVRVFVSGPGDRNQPVCDPRPGLDVHCATRYAEAVAGYTARQFARAIVMPNLAPPCPDSRRGGGYRELGSRRLPRGSGFPRADDTDILTARRRRSARGGLRGRVRSGHLYPPMRPPNWPRRDDISSLHRAGGGWSGSSPCSVPGEFTDPESRMNEEAVFASAVLVGHPGLPGELRIVFEPYHHRRGGRLRGRPSRTSPPPHPAPALINRKRSSTAVSGRMIIAGWSRTRASPPEVRSAATSGSAKFFRGTDSAPHRPMPRNTPAAAQASSTRRSSWRICHGCSRRREDGRMEAFASGKRPRFYGLPLNEGR